MALPLRYLPTTPLEELRGCLGGHLETDTATQVRVQHLLGRLRQQALPELGERLVRASSTPGMKRFILGLTTKFDWPEWSPWILRALLQETDLGVFDDGCAALGRLEVRSAREALEKLAAHRTDPDRQLILRRELTLPDGQTLAFCLGRLLEGAGNPRLAHQGARGLAALARPEDAPALHEAMEGADPLAFRLLLRALADLLGDRPGPILLALFQDTFRDLGDQEALELLASRLQTSQRGSTRAELGRAIAEHMGAAHPDLVQALAHALVAGEAGNPGPPLEALRGVARGACERFLTEATAVHLEGKVARFSAMVAEAQESATQEGALLGTRLDLLCECLVRQTLEGGLTAAQVVPLLQAAFYAHGGSGGLDQAFCCLVPASDTPALEGILSLQDPQRRTACLDALGAREEDALGPFFLRAMQDSIVEVGHCAMHHFSRLPSGFPTVMGMFESGQPEKLRMAFRIFTENATQGAAEPLMGFLRGDVRDDLLLEAVQALGAIRYPASAPVLLDLLHDGKPARLQEALVDALAALATSESAQGLLAKSANLKLPQVLIVALDGALAAFPGFEQPLPLECVGAIEALITRCCDDREGEGRRLPAILATQHLYCFDQALYARLKDAFSDFLFDLRTTGGWDREANDQVAAVLKELGRRSASLGLIAAKEEKLRALAQAVPPQGPGRAPALLVLRETLQDPEFILRAELAQELASFTELELDRKDQDWRDLARLCEIAGLTRRRELAEPLKEVLQRATGLGLRSAAKEGLLALGLSEADLARRAPIHSLLLLDPSAFFRKRLLAALGTTWDVREAGSRIEAAHLLAERPVDLLVSEQADAAGDLRPWLKMQCEARRCRQVLLSTSARDLETGGSWLMGILHKPYAPEALLRALEP